MTRNEFRQRTLIAIASALVKVMDEQADGILDNEAAQTALAVNAVSIMSELEDAAMPHDPMNDHGIYFDDDDDEDFDEDEDVKRESVTFRQKADGTTEYEATVDTGDTMERGGTPLMHDLAKVYNDLRKQHPEITEVTFRTDKDLLVE